jgi:hypothetical protein
MRKYINLITEATQVKDQTSLDSLIDLTGDQTDQVPTISGQAAKPAVALNTASRSQTARAMPDINIPADAAGRLAANSGNLLRDLQAISPEFDDYAAPEALPAPTGAANTTMVPGVDVLPTSQNLPAVVQQSLAILGDSPDFDPQWHQIKNLPGMVSRAIRQVAGQLFGQFTGMDVGEINMIATALNPTTDVQKMMALIKNHGHRIEEMELDFSEHLPSYQEISPDNKAQLWSAFGYDFLLMKDAGGYYVYAWPETERQLTNQHQPRLGR